MKINFIICLMICLCNSCVSNSQDKWSYSKAQGLPDLNEHIYDILFINDSIGFLFGANWTDDVILSRRLLTDQNAVIYKSKNGGKVWQPQSFGKGEFTKGVCIDDTLYVIKHVYNGNSVDRVESSSILKSIDNGNTWQAVSTLPLSIKNIHFYNGKCGLFYVHNYHTNMNNYLFKTSDGGNTWDSLRLEHNDIRYSICTESGIFYFLTPDKFDAQSYNLLVRIDLNKGSESVEKLPFRTSLIAHDYSNLWFLSNNNKNEIFLWLKGLDNKYSLINKFPSNKPIFPECLYIYTKVIVVIISELYEGHVEYRLYRSEDKGVSWKEELLPIAYKAAPVTFYKNERIWISIGGGRLQFRE